MCAEEKIPLGPNVKKLIARKMSLDMVPPGGGLNSALRALSNSESLKQHATVATRWVKAALEVVRKATGKNPWATASDEEIAGLLVKGN